MIKLRIKESNGFLKENVITDITKLGCINNMDDVKDKLQLKLYDVNLQDTILKPIDKPATYMKAKKSPNPLLGIKSNGSLSVWDDKTYKYLRKQGPSIQGIYGNNDFFNVDGDDSIRANFAKCDTFYEIVPVNSDTYKSRSTISGSREPTYLVRLRDTNDIDIGWQADKANKRFTNDDIMAYDPIYNRKRYAKILSLNHLDKYRNEYEAICDDIEELKGEFTDISLRSIMNGNTTYYYKQFLNKFAEVIDKFRNVQNYIGYVANGDSMWTERDLKQKFSEFYVVFNTAQKRLQELQDMINSVEE